MTDSGHAQPSLTDPSDVRGALREAIDRTGYYPEVVSDGVDGAVDGREVDAFYVHHEPTIERDEVRRHVTVVVLTPSRLILAHTDEHAGDDLLPQPYTSTSTEAISALRSVKSVVVTRMVANPTLGGAARCHEAVLTIGWGGVRPPRPGAGRLRRPAVRGRPRLPGVLAADDFSLRVSAAAEGPDAVNSLLEFAQHLSALTQHR